MTQTHDNLPKHTLWTALKRGTLGRCPQCGGGALLASYSKPVASCVVCGEAFGHIRADDGPAWLTILIVGHILGAALLSVVPHSDWPDWLSWTVWPAFGLALILAILPRARGFFIALIWHTGCSGSER